MFFVVFRLVDRKKTSYFTSTSEIVADFQNEARTKLLWIVKLIITWIELVCLCSTRERQKEKNWIPLIHVNDIFLIVNYVEIGNSNATLHVHSYISNITTKHFVLVMAISVTERIHKIPYHISVAVPPFRAVSFRHTHKIIYAPIYRLHWNSDEPPNMLTKSKIHSDIIQTTTTINDTKTEPENILRWYSINKILFWWIKVEQDFMLFDIDIH